MNQHLFAAFGAPDEVLDNQVDRMFVALVVPVAQVVSPVDNLPPYLQSGNGTGFWLKPLKPTPLHPHALRAQRLYGLFCNNRIGIR